jgi:hypothetical protein
MRYLTVEPNRHGHVVTMQYKPSVTISKHHARGLFENSLNVNLHSLVGPLNLLLKKEALRDGSQPDNELQAVSVESFAPPGLS